MINYLYLPFIIIIMPSDIQRTKLDFIHFVIIYVVLQDKKIMYTTKNNVRTK